MPSRQGRICDVGKALGLPEDVIKALSSGMWQMPGSAKGVIFLEDEAGPVNEAVWPLVFEKRRRIAGIIDDAYRPPIPTAAGLRSRTRPTRSTRSQHRQRLDQPL